MQKIKFIISAVIIIVIVIVIVTNVVLAAKTPTPTSTSTSTSTQIELTYPWSDEKSPFGLVVRFYQIGLGLAGAAALGVLIYGAILWTLSGAVTSKQDALEWIKGALWGLILLLAAYLILFTINPNLVELRKAEKRFEKLMPPIKIKPPSPPVGTRVNGGVAGSVVITEKGKRKEGTAIYSCVTKQVCKDKGGKVIETTYCQMRTGKNPLYCDVGNWQYCCEEIIK